ncbi:DUF1232 domain-containing protein [Mycobacterium sp. E2699]|uniref:DUF1232 domain-containing protein n=1 Tax=Mycobacterium sp. E2699 TaxID=1834137 RepID=UPI001E4EDBF0|nr:YkvA family protein [Mycobacterium sp. E2699]
MPDFVPVIGWLDDALLVASCCASWCAPPARRCCKNIGLAHRKDCGTLCRVCGLAQEG